MHFQSSWTLYTGQLLSSRTVSSTNCCCEWEFASNGAYSGLGSNNKQSVSGEQLSPGPHWLQSTTCDGTTTHSCTRQPTSVRHLPGSARKTVVAPNHSVARTLSLNWGCYHFIDCLHWTEWKQLHTPLQRETSERVVNAGSATKQKLTRKHGTGD